MERKEKPPEFFLYQVTLMMLVVPSLVWHFHACDGIELIKKKKSMLNCQQNRDDYR